jgi:hypothetical protein
VSYRSRCWLIVVSASGDLDEQFARGLVRDVFDAGQ